MKLRITEKPSKGRIMRFNFFSTTMEHLNIITIQKAFVVTLDL